MARVLSCSALIIHQTGIFSESAIRTGPSFCHAPMGRTGDVYDRRYIGFSRCNISFKRSMAFQESVLNAFSMGGCRCILHADGQFIFSVLHNDYCSPPGVISRTCSVIGSSPLIRRWNCSSVISAASCFDLVQHSLPSSQRL